MNTTVDITAHWMALHEALGVGASIADEATYERALAFVEAVFDDVAADEEHPLAGLIDLLADRIRGVRKLRSSVA